MPKYNTGPFSHNDEPHKADELYPGQHRSTSPMRPFRAHGNTFQMVDGQWVGKTPPQSKPTHLLAARTPVREDGGRDHDALVITAEKVVIAKQQARALTNLVRDVARKTWWQWCLDSVFKT